MDTVITALRRAPLFSGVTDRELTELVASLSPRAAEYGKGEYLPQNASAFGLVISGAVLITSDDHRGNRNLMLRASAGETFYESYAITGTDDRPDAVAEEKTRVLWFSVEKVIAAPVSQSSWREKLVKNLLFAVAHKELAAGEKAIHMGRRTTRQKLMSYLRAESRRRRSRTFDIPFSRQQLADYLAVDRSAMSAELSALARDGAVKYERSHFELLE